MAKSEFKQFKVRCAHVAPVLNVREEPGGKVVKTIEDGRRVYAKEPVDGWCELKTGGYVMAEFLG